MLDLSSNSAASKEAALRTISDIAAFFRRTEPHNPVAFIAGEGGGVGKHAAR